MEGQTISLEDGSTAVVQGISHGETFSIIIVIMVHLKYSSQIYLFSDLFPSKHLYFAHLL